MGKPGESHPATQFAREDRRPVCWFTFFHEAAHILLHPKKDIYVEMDNQQDKREQEAHAFARNFLIPPQDWKRVALARPRSATEIRTWAAKLAIPAGVLVGPGCSASACCPGPT
jgi:Zn-dependent peptidase ImmA (M78 family)